MKNRILSLLILIIRIVGSIPIVLLFAYLSFWCAMIPIPVVGLIPFALCIIVESGLLCLIWWMLPEITKQSLAGQILSLSVLLLTGVNGVGVLAKMVPGIGTVAGFIINLICMILTALVLGIFFIITGIKAYSSTTA